MKHLLIDFENIQPQNLDDIPTENTHIWLFLGINNKYLTIELAQSLLRFENRVHFIRLQKSGKNALDFYLSYYLGKITTLDREAVIAILSHDGGYDILVEHILIEEQAQKIIRLTELDEIKINPPILLNKENIQEKNSLNIKEKEEQKKKNSLLIFFQKALLALRENDAFHPNYLHNLKKNLQKYILNDLLVDFSEEEKEETVENVINKLKQQKFLEINGDTGTVIYHISNQDLLNRIEIYVLNQRPKNWTDWENLIRKRSEDFALTVSQEDIELFTNHLIGKNLIRRNGNTIEYPPFTKQSIESILPKQKKYQPNPEFLNKTIGIIKLKNRPKKKTGLENILKSLIKCSTEEIAQLIQYLIEQKYLQINDGKITYLK